MAVTTASSILFLQNKYVAWHAVHMHARRPDEYFQAGHLSRVSPAKRLKMLSDVNFAKLEIGEDGAENMAREHAKDTRLAKDVEGSAVGRSESSCGHEVSGGSKQGRNFLMAMKDALHEAPWHNHSTIPLRLLFVLRVAVTTALKSKPG